MTSSKKIVTRFAPSPTGFLTIGNYRTLLFNYIFAKQNRGKLILRIEDTDKKRSKKEYEDDIIESFKWFGIQYDEFYRQSERGDVYKKYLNKLIGEGKAYFSEEKSKEGEGVVNIIRFRNPGGRVKFKDIIRGEVEFDVSDLGDFVIAKSIDEPIFHLAVVIDDFEIGVTHVIRGEDHISNTPRQILIQEAIGADRFGYCHLPLTLAPDRSKLSKRNGGYSIKHCIEKGFLPEAVINYMVLLGWHPEDDQEILSIDEIIKKFDLSRVQKGGAVFDEKKFRWINKEHLKKHPEKIKEKIVLALNRPFDKKIELISKIISERIEVLSDIDEMKKAGEFDYYFNEPALNKDLINWKSETVEKTIQNLERIIHSLSDIEENDFNALSIKANIWDFADREGRGSVLWPMRYSLTGKDKSPDPFSVAEILGKKNAIDRLNKALEILK